MINLERVFPANPGNRIAVVMHTEKAPSIAQAKKFLQELCDNFDRFHSIPVRAASVRDSTWKKAPP